MFLMNLKNHRPLDPSSCSTRCDQRSLAVYTSFWRRVNFFESFTTTRSGTHFLEGKTPKHKVLGGSDGFNRSLTMTYFHTGTRTIIGAKAFHCPVRDGKEWYHLAMVVRHNWLPG